MRSLYCHVSAGLPPSTPPRLITVTSLSRLFDYQQLDCLFNSLFRYDLQNIIVPHPILTRRSSNAESVYVKGLPGKLSCIVFAAIDGCFVDDGGKAIVVLLRADFI